MEYALTARGRQHLAVAGRGGRSPAHLALCVPAGVPGVLRRAIRRPGVEGKLRLGDHRSDGRLGRGGYRGGIRPAPRGVGRCRRSPTSWSPCCLCRRPSPGGSPVAPPPEQSPSLASLLGICLAYAGLRPTGGVGGASHRPCRASSGSRPRRRAAGASTGLYDVVFVRPFLWLARRGKDDVVDKAVSGLAWAATAAQPAAARAPSRDGCVTTWPAWPSA